MDAQFSIPWGVATALVRKRVGLEDFTPEAIGREEVLNLADKMVVEVDNALKKGDKSYPARVEMTTRHGETYTQQVDEPLGSLERPMSLDACAEKFRDCTKRLERGQTEKVIDLVADLEKVKDLRQIIEALRYRR